MKTFFRELLITLTVAVIIFVAIQTTIQSFIVVGLSMYPSLVNGQRLLVNKAVYHFHEPERGDVIVFEPIDGGQADYIKRVIAQPGDTVEIKNSVVYVNGSPLDEPYIKNPPSYTTDEQKIPQNNYFVLGDNRDSSNDSHNGWMVPHEKIIGKAWVSMWPPDKWGLVPNYSLEEQLVDAIDSYLAVEPLR